MKSKTPKGRTTLPKGDGLRGKMMSRPGKKSQEDYNAFVNDEPEAVNT